MSNIITYAEGDCSEEAKKIYAQMEKESNEALEAFRGRLDHIEKQMEDGNPFAEKYLMGLLEEIDGDINESINAMLNEDKLQ